MRWRRCVLAPTAVRRSPRSRCPTLVIVGDEDTLTPPELSQVIADGIAGATLVRIPRAGHLANVEQSPAFSSALAAFLEGLGS